jgi:hypothetical protein
MVKIIALLLAFQFCAVFGINIADYAISQNMDNIKEEARY